MTERDHCGINEEDVRSAHRRDAWHTEAANPQCEPGGRRGGRHRELEAGFGITLVAAPEREAALALVAPEREAASQAPRQILQWSVTAEQQQDRPDTWFDEHDDGFSVGWPGYADFRFRVGDDPALTARSTSITEHQALLASILSIIPLGLPLLGLEPLHGAAVGCQDGALLLIGDSGAGKSTLSREFVRRRATFLSDDVCAIGERSLLWPGPPLSCHHEASDLTVGMYGDKHVARLPRAVCPQNVPVAATVFLSPALGCDLEFTTLSAAESFALLLRHARTPSLFVAKRLRRQFAFVAALSTTPSFVAHYDTGCHRPEQVADALARSAGLVELMG